MSSRINVGWLALAFAWLIGVYQAGLRPDAVMAGFPVTLFLTLAGVTLLFSIAETNGTLDRLARRAIQLARGSRRVIPVSSSSWRARSRRSVPAPSRRLRSSRRSQWRLVSESESPHS